MSIVHNPKKITHDMLGDKYNSTRVVNLVHYPRFPELTKLYESRSPRGMGGPQKYVENNYHDPSVARNLPKPNLSTNFEGSPHLWLLEDEETGIQFLFYSDGRRKNHYKGAAIEVVMNKKLTDADLTSAYRNLLDYLGSHVDKKEVIATEYDADKITSIRTLK